MTHCGSRWTDSRWAMAALLVAHAGLLLFSSRVQFPTRNEVAHVPAGISHWHTWSFGLYGVNPPLWRMVATLPTLVLAPRMDGIEPPAGPGERPEWDAARTFAAQNEPNYFTLVWLARLAGIGWSLLGGIVIYRWAGELYGRSGGLLALALWCFGPNVLAHASLVTPDIPSAVSGLVATYAFRGYLRTGTWAAATAAGLLLGVAQLTKFTLLVLYPLWLLIGVVYVLTTAGRLRPTVSYRTRLVQAAYIAATSVWLINLGYGFDGSLLPLGSYQFVSDLFGGVPAGTDGFGNRFRDSVLGPMPVPLPYDYLAGIDLQRRDFEGRLPSYLCGVWRDRGWWYFYLYALWVKVPLGTLALAAWGLVLSLTRSSLSASTAEEVVLWVPAVGVLTFVSSQTGFTHHLRYVLPMAPYVVVATGKLAGYTGRTRAVVAALAAWSVVSSLAVFPHSLSYFNEVAGGAVRGPEHLADSNVDWGQDLFHFKDWVDQHPEVGSIRLLYWNYVAHRLVGTDYPPAPSNPGPGWYAVDVFNLYHPNGRGHFFQRLQPRATAGYSIYIFCVTPDQAGSVGPSHPP